MDIRKYTWKLEVSKDKVTFGTLFVGSPKIPPLEFSSRIWYAKKKDFSSTNSSSCSFLPMKVIKQLSTTLFYVYVSKLPNKRVFISTPELNSYLINKIKSKLSGRRLALVPKEIPITFKLPASHLKDPHFHDTNIIEEPEKFFRKPPDKPSQIRNIAASKYHIWKKKWRIEDKAKDKAIYEIEGIGLKNEVIDVRAGPSMDPKLKIHFNKLIRSRKEGKLFEDTKPEIRKAILQTDFREYELEPKNKKKSKLEINKP